MKNLFFCVSIAISVFSFQIFGQTTSAEVCKLPIDSSPKLFKFKLGMSTIDVSKALNSTFPSPELIGTEDSDIVDIALVDGKYKEYWSVFVNDPSIGLSLKMETKYISVGVKRVDYHPEKDPEFSKKDFVDGVSSMSFYFYEDVLFKFSASYPVKNWKNEKDLGLSIAKQIDISSDLWKFDKYGGRLDCGSFSIETRDMGKSPSAAVNDSVTSGGLRRFVVSMENTKIGKDIRTQAIEKVIENENKLLAGKVETKKQERSQNEFAVTTLGQLDLYPEEYVGKNVYFRATPRDVQRVSEGFFSVGLSSGGVSSYGNDLKYISSVYGRSGLNIVAYKGFPSWLDSYNDMVQFNLTQKSL